MRRLAFALWVSACATAAQPAHPPAAPKDDILALAPEGADVLAEIDVARLRGFPPMLDLVKMLPPDATAKLQRGIGADWEQVIDRVVLWFRRRGASDVDFLMFTQGRFPDSMSEALREPGSGAEDYRGVAIYDHEGRASAQLKHGLWVAGTQVAVRSAVDVLRGIARPLGDEPVVRLRAGERAAALRIAAMLGERDPAIGGSRPSTMLLRLDTTDRLDLTVTFGHDSADQALRTEQALRDQLEEMRHGLAPLGLESYFDGIIVAAQGTRVVATLSLSRPQCDRLVKLLAHLMPLLQGQSQ